MSKRNDGTKQKTKGTDGTKKKTKQRSECRALARFESGEHTRWRWKDAKVCRELWGTCTSSHCPEAIYPKRRKGRS